MDFFSLGVPGVWVIEPRVHSDERGFFFESYRKSSFEDHDIREDFIQDNHCRSRKGVLRGLHFQIVPFEQAKLVRVVSGKIFDAVVDIRPNSETFGRYAGVELSADNRKVLYVPKGFAHGYCVLEENTEVLYKVSAIWSPSHERGIVWNDSEVGIEWPQLKGGFQVSSRDRQYPTLKEFFCSSKLPNK